MPTVAVVGLQYGDEGKGRIVDLLSESANVCIRPNGGCNAGHTICHEGETHKLRHLPSAVLHKTCELLIGAGSYVDAKILCEELTKYDAWDRFHISSSCNLILPHHKQIDKEWDKEMNLQTTGSGIGPCSVSKYLRCGCRLFDCKSLQTFTESVVMQNRILKTGIELQDLSKYYEDYVKPLLKVMINIPCYLRCKYQPSNLIMVIEGAQGFGLDIDSGQYPHVTSSSCSTAGLLTSSQIPLQIMSDVCGVIKAYATRSGSGQLLTEIHDQSILTHFHNNNEIGVNTLRKRRIGWLDLPMIKYGIFVNGVSTLALTCVDILFQLKEIKVCTHYTHVDDLSKVISCYSEMTDHYSKYLPLYEVFDGNCVIDSETTQRDQLPSNIIKFLERIESDLRMKISILSIGKERDQCVLSPDIIKQHLNEENDD